MELSRARINETRHTCVQNARRHLEAAKLLNENGSNNLAFHCALLALEEVGKSVILMMNRSDDLPDEKQSLKWVDDHTKKIFWAVWSIIFGKTLLTEAQFSEYQDISRNLHNRRLQSLYVDTNSGFLQEIQQEEASSLIHLTESRVSMEESADYEGELSAKDQDDLQWFAHAAENDPETRRFIWTWAHLDKLHEFGGDVRCWVPWLRAEVEAWQQKGRDLLQAELQRVSRNKTDKGTPKWKARFTLFSGSHSIRPRTLSEWNKTSNFIQMFPGGERNELRLEITLPKSILVGELWHHLFDVVSRLTLALNIGAQGFFWWYLPAYKSKFYDSITDLDSSSDVKIESDPGIGVDWGHHAFRKEETNNFTIIFGYLAGLKSELLNCFDSYMRGLGLVAKADFFVNLQVQALIEFHISATLFLQSLGESGDLAEAMIRRGELPEEAATHLQSLLDMVSQLTSTGPPPQPPTITHALYMKLYLDRVIGLEARAHLARIQTERKGKV
jgi:AbiV family abortive infection protein